MKKLLALVFALASCIATQSEYHPPGHPKYRASNAAPLAPGQALPRQTRQDDADHAALQGPDDKGDGHDIVTLIARRKIDVITQGNGIQSVSLKLKKLVPETLEVSIPVGTFMVSSNSGSQNMVTTSSESLTLSDDQWHEVSADAACANRPKHIPGNDDSFKVLRSPHQAELARLMPVLNSENVNYPTRQAAVWIVTDDADYDDLGILQASSNGLSGTRVIEQEEAARAMRICDKAGISITRKAIWRDRQQILSGLREGALKTWLEQKQ